MATRTIYTPSSGWLPKNIRREIRACRDNREKNRARYPKGLKRRAASYRRYAYTTLKKSYLQISRELDYTVEGLENWDRRYFDQRHYRKAAAYFGTATRAAFQNIQNGQENHTPPETRKAEPMGDLPENALELAHYGVNSVRALVESEKQTKQGNEGFSYICRALVLGVFRHRTINGQERPTAVAKDLGTNLSTVRSWEKRSRPEDIQVHYRAAKRAAEVEALKTQPVLPNLVVCTPSDAPTAEEEKYKRQEEDIEEIRVGYRGAKFSLTLQELFEFCKMLHALDRE